jgi:hypothetical protein
MKFSIIALSAVIAALAQALPQCPAAEPEDLNVGAIHEVPVVQRILHDKLADKTVTSTAASPTVTLPNEFHVGTLEGVKSSILQFRISKY